MAQFVTVECKLNDSKPFAIIHHDIEKEVKVGGYERPQSYRYVYVYRYLGEYFYFCVFIYVHIYVRNHVCCCAWIPHFKRRYEYMNSHSKFNVYMFADLIRDQ